MPDTKYLVQKYNMWWFRIGVPDRLRSHVGKREILISLKTGDLRTAQRRRDIHLARVREMFDQYQGVSNEWYLKPDEVITQAKIQRKKVEAGEITKDEADREIFDAWIDNVGLNEKELGVESAYKTADDVLAGKTVDLLSEVLEAHLKELGTTARKQTVSARRRKVGLFIDHVGDKIISDTTRKNAGSFITEILVQMDRAEKTKREYLTDLIAYFNWAKRRGFIEANPFEGQTLPTQKRGTVKKTEGKRRSWTDEELKKLMSETVKDKKLHLLVQVAIYTGMRLNEICELETKDVNLEDAYFDLTEGKTESSIRKVPIHSAIIPMVEDRVEKGLDGYLIPGLKSGGEDDKRGHSIGKKFGRVKKELFPKEKGLVFHSLRNTFITKLENAGVALNYAELIVGHARQSMSYGLYSQSVDIEHLKDAVERVSYQL